MTAKSSIIMPSGIRIARSVAGNWMICGTTDDPTFSREALEEARRMVEHLDSQDVS